MCVETDACALSNPCIRDGDSAAKCEDVRAPKTGHTCKCSAGFQAHAGVCIDAKGCDTHTCDKVDKGAKCFDLSLIHI